MLHHCNDHTAAATDSESISRRTRAREEVANRNGWNCRHYYGHTKNWGRSPKLVASVVVLLVVVAFNVVVGRGRMCGLLRHYRFRRCQWRNFRWNRGNGGFILWWPAHFSLVTEHSLQNRFSMHRQCDSERERGHVRSLPPPSAPFF